MTKCTSFKCVYQFALLIKGGGLEGWRQINNATFFFIFLNLKGKAIYIFNSFFFSTIEEI